jgi:hypothetical protein
MVRMTQAANETNRATEDGFKSVAVLNPELFSSESGGNGVYIGNRSWLHMSSFEQQLIKQR